MADGNVNGTIVRGLQLKGMDVVRAQDRGLCGQPDEVVLATASGEGRVLLTNDRDFPALNARWQAAGRGHAGINYWRQN